MKIVSIHRKMGRINIFILNEETHYGDGQHYFNCKYCGKQYCFWTESKEGILCDCGAQIKVIEE